MKKKDGKLSRGPDEVPQPMTCATGGHMRMSSMVTVPEDNRPRIEMVPVRDVKFWPGNPKEHDVEQIRASMRRFGFTAPLIMDERTGRLVAGHGRVEALCAARDAGEAPPERVEVRNGEWCVPVVRGVSFADEREALAYVIADNKLTEIGGWERGQLQVALRELGEAVEGIGFDDVELRRYLGEWRASDDLEAVQTRVGEYAVIIECASEHEQREALGRCAQWGWRCRALT